jgi:hypothetical protein
MQYDDFIAEKKYLLNFLDESGKTDISNLAIRAVFPANSHLAYRTFRGREKSNLAYFIKRHEVLYG